MKAGVHRDWMVALVLIVIIICGTLIWINHNSWTVRFEMDDNTLKAIESVEWDSLNNQEEKVANHGEDWLWNNGEGRTATELVALERKSEGGESVK